MIRDEVVKGAMAGYFFKSVEIASYTALIVAAQAAGDTQTKAGCEQVLPQAEARLGQGYLGHWVNSTHRRLQYAFSHYQTLGDVY